MTLTELLEQLEHHLWWEQLKRATKDEAELMERLAPLFVENTIKLVRTRSIQAQSSAKRGKTA